MVKYLKMHSMGLAQYEVWMNIQKNSQLQIDMGYPLYPHGNQLEAKVKTTGWFV